MANIEQVKKLRAKTGAPYKDCLKALAENNGDIDAAIVYLRSKSLADVVAREGKPTQHGTIGNYIHAGSQLAALVELNCETDFVARTEKFVEFAHKLAMHIVARSPLYLTPGDMSKNHLESIGSVFRMQLAEEKKPQHLWEKILTGKMEKYYDQVCLLRQSWTHDIDLSVEQAVAMLQVAVKENIKIGKFCRIQVGVNE